MKKTLWLVLLLGLSQLQPLCAAATNEMPSLDAAMASPTDLWGELAMRQPNGASYEFFAPLLPPLRYVNADFRYYPIVLSAPNAKMKARLISNGSGVNLRGGSRAWNDVGTPVKFRVGPDEFEFGGLRDRVSEPTLAEGWLPIVEIRYRHPTPLLQGGKVPLGAKTPEIPGEIYRLEAFAATDPALASNGVVFVKFDLAQGTNGTAAVEVGSGAALRFRKETGRDQPATLLLEDEEPGAPAASAPKSESKLTGRRGKVLALFDANWKWDRGRAIARLTPGKSVTLAIATQPIPKAAAPVLSAATYAGQRELCARTWRDLLARGLNVETPEPYVNDAWRHLLCQNFELINGDRIHYSAGNQYDKLYESEGSDAALALMVWGFDSDMRRLIVPLFDFLRKDLECHQAGFKLNNLCRYYWQTRDAAAVRELRTRWLKEAARLMERRARDHDLCAKGQYCGDISTMVYSLTVNAKGWRALHDLSAVLDEVGETAEARRIGDDAAKFKKSVLTAIEKSTLRDTSPPFVPVALYADEPTHSPITATRIGCYWNIVIGYVIGSGIFPPGSAEENWIPHFQEQHGGLCMGMLRAGGGFAFWTSPYRINPLYGTRYALDTLRRDDPERALVSFYGMLAQGLTRNTFIGGEGCSLSPIDEGGRLVYCPPNSAANAHLLSMLRTMLVQDWDLNEDGKPETLRLGFATPKRWLEDGKTIRVERAPTAFGPVSFTLESKLSQGAVVALVDLPERNQPKQTLLRARVPDGWRVTSAQSGSQSLTVDERGTADLSSLKGKITVRFAVAKS